MAPPPQNRALWLPKKQSPIHVIDAAPYHTPEADELVIQTKAVAINPADVALQKLGIIIDVYPAILGCDVAGIVVETGSGIAAADFKVGDRVIGQAQPLPGGVYKYAGFQQYVVLKLPSIARIPPSPHWTDAVVLPLAINTAASCLFQEGTLALDMPPPPPSTPTPRMNAATVLIWGASSSVGSCGVQLATAAGYDVFGIASAQNHAFVKSLGATRAFDHNDPHIIPDIIAALEGKDCVGAFDAISTETTLYALCEILHAAEGRKRVASVMPGAERFSKHGVAVVTNFQKRNSETPVGQHVWRRFLEPAMTAGVIQFKPPAEVVGHGLEEVQGAMDLMSRGVSAKKLVVSLD